MRERMTGELNELLGMINSDTQSNEDGSKLSN